jgi:hypothetical protein
MISMTAASRRALALLLHLAPLLATGACVSSVRGNFQRAPQVSGPIRLEVHTGSGDVTVRSGATGQVAITGRIVGSSGLFGGSSEEEVRQLEKSPPIKQTGNTIVIENVSYDNISIDYEITVPTETQLAIETGSGDCEVGGLRGDVTVQTGSGDVQVDDVTGNVKLDTGSGTIHARRVAGSFDAHTGSGNIGAVLAGPGNVRARTGSGDTDVRGVVGSLDIDTGSGDIVAEGVPRARWNVGTSSGDVEVLLAHESSFDLDVSTGSGNIHVDRPVHTVRQGEIDDDDDHLAGRVGQGGPLVRVSTGSGDVSVR